MSHERYLSDTVASDGQIAIGTIGFIGTYTRYGAERIDSYMLENGLTVRDLDAISQAYIHDTRLLIQTIVLSVIFTAIIGSGFHQREENKRKKML